MTDQGTHEFDVLLRSGSDWDMGAVQRTVDEMLRPPIVWDVTG